MGLDFIADTDLRLAIRSGGAIGVRAHRVGQTPEAPLCVLCRRMVSSLRRATLFSRLTLANLNSSPLDLPTGVAAHERIG